MLRKITTWLLVILYFLGIALPVQAATTPVSFSVTTDKSAYNQTDTINLTISAANTTSGFQTLRFNSSCQVSYKIGTVFDYASTQACKPAISLQVLSPHQTKTWQFSYDLKQNPLPAGAYNITADIIGNGTAQTTITINGSGDVPPPTPSGQFSITTNSSLTALVNQPYNAIFTAVGSQGPVTFTLSNGSIPTGLSLTPVATPANSIGLSGTPIKIGVSAMELTATDTASHTAVATFVIIVTKPNTTLYSFVTSSPLTGKVNQPFTATITAVGEQAPVRLSLQSGLLPAGITVSACSITGCTDGHSAILSGTPTRSGIFSFTLKAVYTGGTTLTQSFAITIKP